jgi:DNA mismatch endonuclease (patch repair protein)
MVDVFSPAKRSAVMARIRSKGNLETEMAMIRLFREHGIAGWRRHQPVCGRPDFIFRKARLAVFVDGCFWHGCPQHGTVPASNRPYWKHKLERNYERDQQVNRELRKREWRVLRIWHHELSSKNQAKLLRRLTRALTIKGIVGR